MSLGLAIVGYGKMGRMIAELAPEYGFEVRAKFSRASNLHDAAVNQKSLRGIDAGVEFTVPDAAPDNLRRLASLGINAICGTTGWYEHLPAVNEAVLAAGTRLGYGPSLWVGGQVVLQAVAHAACLFAK